jgi:hypothetical protein
MKPHVVALLFASWPVAAAAPDHSLLGAWRITHGVVAPFAVEAPIEAGMIGVTVRFLADRVEGRGPLACANARYEATMTPPDGLFQGGLPAPAAEGARALGFSDGAVPGVMLACDSGVFEFHAADADARLFALDNVVWTMSSAYGASAAPRSPEAAVEALLEYHFNGDHEFLEPAATARAKWLTPSLKRAIAVYFDRRFPADEVPPIDGDPFTDSQEFPTRFAVREGQGDARTVDVPVDFADGYSARRVFYRLRKIGGGDWRVDDLLYAHGGTLREALVSPN